jgi:hypothetical protein
MASFTTLDLQLIRILIRMFSCMRRYVAMLEEDKRAVQEHNRLLIEAATESARKLEENTRLLTDAATESARKLQEREAELTQAIAALSRRVVRVTEHNRWLSETALDAVSEIKGGGANATEVGKLFAYRAMQQLQKLEDNIQASMSRQKVSAGINEVDALRGDLA